MSVEYVTEISVLSRENVSIHDTMHTISCLHLIFYLQTVVMRFAVVPSCSTLAVCVACKRYPMLHVYCAMQRKSGYYIANIVVPLFLITGIAFAGVEYGIGDEYDSLSPRMDVSLGTCAALLFVRHCVEQTLRPILLTAHSLVMKRLAFNCRGVQVLNS